MQTDATLLANNSQRCWMLHVASVCRPCCKLWRCAGSCCAKFETDLTFETNTPNISFVQCWIRLRSSSNIIGTTHAHYTWVVSFPRSTAGPNIVGSCCICLHITAILDATTSNFVVPTMFEVVAFA